MVVKPLMGRNAGKEGVRKCFAECNPRAGLIVEHFVNEVEQIQCLRVFRLHVSIEWFALLPYVSTRRRVLVKVQLPVIKIFCLCAFGHSVRDIAENALHHGQMLAVLVSLEESDAHVQLEENTANRPNIARLIPAQFQNDLRSSIMPSGHNGGVMFVVEGGRTEVD